MAISIDPARSVRASCEVTPVHRQGRHPEDVPDTSSITSSRLPAAGRTRRLTCIGRRSPRGKRRIGQSAHRADKAMTFENMITPNAATPRELFDQIIRIWGARPDPSEGLTLKQIANLVLGGGTDANAAIIGRTIVDFHDYFHQPDGAVYLWHVRWKKVEQDHHHLFPRAVDNVSPIPSRGHLGDMLQALNDEIGSVRKEIRDHPIKANIFRTLGQMPEGGFWYEAKLELPGDTELPVPEGVEIRLRWPRRLNVYPCDAKLLSYDPLKSAIIFETEQPLGDTHIKNQFEIVPNIEQLIQAVVQQLGRASQYKDRVIWRLIEEHQQRLELPWSGVVVRNQLDDTQIGALQSCLRHDITFLWGPPGTGKTHTLGRLMASAALSGRRIIASSISNIAVDQMALHLVRALESAGDEGVALLNEGRIIRFGHPRDPAVSAEARLFPNKTEIQRLRKDLHDAQQQLRDLREGQAELRARLQHEIFQLKAQLRSLTRVLVDKARIVLTTAVQICIEPAIGERSFDFVVIDEASMMPIPYAICAGALGRDQVVITGDFRQLGPIALAHTAAAHRWLHKDVFELAGIRGDYPQHRALGMLQVQRRMDQAICSLINKPFYAGILQTATKPRSSSLLPPLPGEAAILISFLPEDGSAVEQTVDGSRINRKSAEFVAQLVAQYLSNDSDAIVGVIAPYRGQVTCIRRLLRERSLPQHQTKRLRLGTVHAFQGSEADVIVWDLVDTRNHKIGRLYHQDTGERLTNVAISRAQGKLVIVGDPDAFFLAPGKESVGKLRNILAINFHSNSPRVVEAQGVLLHSFSSCSP